MPRALALENNARCDNSLAQPVATAGQITLHSPVQIEAGS